AAPTTGGSARRAGRRRAGIRRAADLASGPFDQSSGLSPVAAAPQVVLEQLQNALVFVRPARFILEAVVLHREDSDRPVLLAELDQPLNQPDRVLEEHVRVHHAVADEQRAL